MPVARNAGSGARIHSLNAHGAHQPLHPLPVDPVALVDEWAKEYGNKLKIQWKLPIELRDMIGAVHYLADGTVKRERLIMRAAALKTEGQEDSEEYLTLKRRIGIDSDERQDSKEGNESE